MVRGLIITNRGFIMLRLGTHQKQHHIVKKENMFKEWETIYKTEGRDK